MLFGALSAPLGRSLSNASWLGLYCFVVTFGLATAYMSVLSGERETAILIWQLHMLVLMLLYGLAILSRAPCAAEPIPGMYLVLISLFAASVLWFHGLPPITDENIVARRSIELFAMCVIPCLIWVYITTLWGDWTAIAIWVILALWETCAAVLYLLCAILIPDVLGLNEQWGITVNKMACSRAWGEPLSKLPHFIATGLVACILIIEIFRKHFKRSAT